MKKTIFSALFLLIAQLSFAQYFTLSPNGLVSESKNDYVVVDVPGVKKEQLYKNVLNAINTLYSNPQKGLNVLAGESINLNGYQKRAIKSNAGVMTYDYDVDYTLSFLFKDGKIRVNSPTFTAEMQNISGTWNKLNVERAFFNNKGEVRSVKHFNQANEFFNGLIKNILDKSGNVDNW